MKKNTGEDDPVETTEKRVVVIHRSPGFLLFKAGETPNKDALTTIIQEE